MGVRRDQIAADRLVELGPAFGVGHAASPGRTRLNGDAAPRWPRLREEMDWRAMMAAIPLSMVRLCISHLTFHRLVD